MVVRRTVTLTISRSSMRNYLRKVSSNLVRYKCEGNIVYVAVYELNRYETSLQGIIKEDAALWVPERLTNADNTLAESKTVSKQSGLELVGTGFEQIVDSADVLTEWRRINAAYYQCLDESVHAV